MMRLTIHMPWTLSATVAVPLADSDRVARQRMRSVGCAGCDAAGQLRGTNRRS